MTPVRLEPAALRSRVKHSTTELHIFLLILACDLALGLIYIVHWLCYTPAQYYGNRRGVTMTLLESETVDHPWKSEEKTQNTESHNTIKLEQPNQVESTSTTSQNN